MDPVNVKVIYCRICGIKAKKCVKIFSNRGRGMGLENKILKCLMLSVKRSDHLPTRVCFPCIDRLDDYSQFLLHVKQAQVKLRAMLKSQGVHFKDERNNELIATWKALLAHQERESDFGERGRKRKRKMDEKIYDTSDSSSDSVSDDSSSDGDNVTDGIPPCKKIALSNNEMNIVGFPLKSEAPDIRSTTPDNTPVSKQNSMGNSQHSKSISSDLNTDASNVCSSFPVPSASSTVPSKVSQMQEDEITTSEEPISLAEGSSSSIHHPTTSTTSEISVTISPPLWFPTQMSDSMIVMPGTSGKPPSSGMVPFYIWNMPKGGTSTEVSRKSLPTMPIGKQNLPAPLDKPKISRDVLSTSHTLSKRSLQTKPAATTSSVGKIIVVMGSENSDALPTSVSSQNQTLSVDPDNSCISNLRSETSCVAQESPLKKSDLNETSVKTNFLSVNKSLILPNQGNEFLSKMSNGTEKSSSNSISPVNLESGAHVSNTTPNQILKESSQLNETLSDFEGMRDNVSSAVSVNSIQSVSSNTCLIQLPVSQNTGGINQNEGQNASSNSHVPTMVSNSDMSKNDVSATPQGAQDIVPTNSSHEVPGTAISSRMSVNSADLSSTHKPSSNKSDVVPGTINSVVRKGTGVELLEVERPSATASVVAKAGAPQSDLSTVSLTSVSDMGMKVTNLARPCVSSVISKTSGEDKEIQVFDLCDIPPLIPISESKLKHYSDLECDGISASMPRPTVTVPTITVVNDLDLEPEPLVIDEVCVSDNSDSGAEVSFNSVAKKSKESKASKSDSSNAKKSRESKVSKSDSLKKISTPAQKSSEWLASESVGIDFTVNPDYSVVKCCLCSTGTYPFLITLASASDHCKFIHSLGTCSFGCIKCDFTTDEQVEIPQQLKVLHHHVSSGCPPPDAPDSGSPQKKAENGIDVAEVKMEPVDVYETALKNLKNSMQKVNMPRFRKLLTTFKPSSPAVKDCSQRNVKAEGMEGSSNEGQIMLMDTSRSRLFTRKGSTYICRICDKKTNSKHQVKMHIGRHKPCERERLLMIDFRRSCALSSGRDDEEMIFDIPRIKIEKDDSPQAMESRSDIEPLRCTTDSLSNISVTSLHDNSSTPKMSSKKTPKSVERNSDISERETSKHNTNQVKKSTATPSSSGVKIPFIKGEPHMFSSADKVTHKANTSDSFSFNPLLKKSSDGSGQSYVNPSRNFRSKPIVKPLYKSPTTHKEDSSPSLVSPVASSSSSGDDLKLKVEQPSPFKRMVEDKQTCQPEKKISFKIVKPSSDTSSPVGSKSKKLVNEGATIGKPSHAPHIVVRGNLNPMKVIRPKSLEPSKMCESKRACFVKPKQQSSPQIAKPLTNYESAVNFGSPMKSQSECMALNLPKKLQDESMTANSTNKLQNKSMTSTPPKKLQTESMTVNGVVLKVPFIKLQRLNLVNIDPRIGFVNESGAHCDNEENVNKGNSGDTRSGAMVNQSEKSCGSSQKPSTSGKHKKEGSEKSEESILGW